MMYATATLRVHSAVTTGENFYVKTWSQAIIIVHNVDRHVCGHSKYSDMRTLLLRKKLWYDDIKEYLGYIIRRCTSFFA